jgi:molybdenum cofactor sulfurtransferase
MQSEKTNRDIFFNCLRRKEFSRLDKLRHVYLDYTGGSLYPQSLLDNHFNFLKNGLFGNPHSTNPASALSENMVKEARQTVLEFFNAPDYYCVFTANATGALQIVGECYPFSPKSHLLLTVDNHNSVNGIREYCCNKGGSYTYSPMSYDDLTINAPELNKQLASYIDKKSKLFAYPAQSNASGVQHSLAWVLKAKKLGWDVLLDAAAFVPTSALNLSIVQPEFVSISFYKMFGYPTGIGCLLIKKSVFKKMEKPWFAGGTLSLSSVKSKGYFLKPDYEKFENGTINYLNIPAITNGLHFITAIGMCNISSRIKDLSIVMISGIVKLKHNNGLPLIKLYGSNNTENRGGNFLLNFFDAAGYLYPFEKIQQLANAAMISLRTGCFCNPGIDEVIHNLPAKDVENYFTSRADGDYDDMIQFLGKMRGAVRISFGLATTSTDIEIFFRFAKSILNNTIYRAALTPLQLTKNIIA